MVSDPPLICHIWFQNIKIVKEKMLLSDFTNWVIRESYVATNESNQL